MRVPRPRSKPGGVSEPPDETPNFDEKTIETPFDPEIAMAGSMERVSLPPTEPERPSTPPSPTIEIEYIHETDFTKANPDRWALLEIWTRNRIYHVDPSRKCIAVVQRSTGEAEPNHSLVGARLTGGERRLKQRSAMDVYYPYPMPGTEAVFQHDAKRGSYASTSTIERVVLRIRKMTAGTIDTARSWDEITGRFTIR